MKETKADRIEEPDNTTDIKQSAKLVVVCVGCGKIVGQDSGCLTDRIIIDIARLFHIRHEVVTWNREKNQVLSGVRCNLSDFN